jgi:hypothetical protein
VYVSGAPGTGKTSLAVPLAADAPAVVIEANFRPYSQYARAKLSGLAAQPVEVHCACPVGRPAGIGALVTVDTTLILSARTGAVVTTGKR